MLNSANFQKIIAGLVDRGVEFFVHQNEIKCTHDGKVYVFDQIPSWIIDIVNTDMLNNPEALRSLASWENLSEQDYLRQYIYCRFGGIDTDPDIDENGVVHYAEYFDCGLRGVCKYEGKLCRSIKADVEGYISSREIDVIRLINEPNKLIADKLNISTETIETHMQNIRNKTGLNGKVEIAIWAVKRGII